MSNITKVQPWALLLLFSLSYITDAMCSTALPNIARYLDTKPNIAQLSSSAYFIGFAFGILSLGRISDIIGRRPVVLFGMLIYVLASLSSIFAPNILALIGLRFTQAFGASVGSVIAQAMARDSYSGSRLSHLYATLSVGLAFTPSFGSIVGGYIVQYLKWNYIFAFLGIWSSVLTILYFIFLPETNKHIGRENHDKYFKVLKKICTDEVVLLYALIVGAFNSITFGFYIEAPFIFIRKIGISASHYGILIMLLTMTHITGAFLCKYLIKHDIDNRRIMTYGSLCSIVGTFLLFVGSLREQYVHSVLIEILITFVPMIIHIIGHSFLMPMTLRYALEDYAKVTGTAGSIFGFLYYVIIGIAIFLVSRLHSNESTVGFTSLLLILSILCYGAFYIIQKIHTLKRIKRI
ncbi:MAG: Bcr/CflA family efflux MFS transporter [Rickettsiaceae bacterium]